jgi:hypothetical protein
MKKSFLYSWLDPNGNFHPVPMMGHYDYAFDYLEEEEKLDPEYILDKNAMDLFFSKGWFRISNNQKEKTIYVGGIKKYPSNIQLRNIKNLALTYGYNQINFEKRMIDQSGVPDKILWKESTLLKFKTFFNET